MTTIQNVERDELATVIERAYDLNEGMASFELLAHAALTAGYRKPRTVTTAEELNALPFEAVIRDAEGHVLERWGDAEHVQWSTPGCKWFVPVTEIALPVTVLYEVQP